MGECIEKYMCAHRLKDHSFGFEVFVRFFQFSLKKVVGLTRLTCFARAGRPAVKAHWKNSLVKDIAVCTVGPLESKMSKS